MKATIYHNPRCSKSRQTLALLEDNNIEPEIIEYLKTPPNKNTLKQLLKKLEISAAELLRKKESVFKELDLGEHLDNENKLLDEMIANPVLIERPIVVINDKAVIGRPPENILDII